MASDLEIVAAEIADSDYPHDPEPLASDILSALAAVGVLRQLRPVEALDEPVRGDETAEVDSPAYLGTGPERTLPPPRSYVGTFWHGWFVGCATGALAANVVWWLLT